MEYIINPVIPDEVKWICPTKHIAEQVMRGSGISLYGAHHPSVIPDEALPPSVIPVHQLVEESPSTER